MDKCRAKIEVLLHEVIDGRRDAILLEKTSSYGEDLLGCMLTTAIDGWDEQTQTFNMASVFNNCKLFYFAGQDTVATTTMFSMLLLANHPWWQDRARQEVLEVLGDGGEYHTSALAQLKVVLSSLFGHFVISFIALGVEFNGHYSTTLNSNIVVFASIEAINMF